jgi:hypothetical protein
MAVRAPQEEGWRKRLLDMPRLIKAHDPNAPKPWVVEPFAIKGTLAIVAGKGGAGKTWVMHEAAAAVAEGSERAGMRGHTGGALIFDGEMGEWLTVDRFKTQCYPDTIDVFNAQGLDLRTDEHRQLVKEAVFGLMPSFIGFDSLKALTPTGHENESDDMGPVVNWIRWLCDQVKAAGMLIHHAGWKEDRTRGSSAIKDRADTVWYLSTPDEEGRQRLTCHGGDLKAPRWQRPPDDIWVRIREKGGLETCGAAPSSKDKASTRERILEHVNGVPLNKTEIEFLLGFKSNNKGVRRTVDEMVDDGILAGSDKKGYTVNPDWTPGPTI